MFKWTIPVVLLIHLQIIDKISQTQLVHALFIYKV